MAKLAPSQVLSILHLRRRRQRDAFTPPRPTLKEVGSLFGVTAETIRQIECRRTWKKLVIEDGIDAH